MVILFVTETLHLGGAETFVVRLANRLVGQHEVVLANLHPEHSDARLITQLDPRVVYRIPKGDRKWQQKVDGAFLRLGVDSQFLNRDLVTFLSRVIAEMGPDIVHSHLFKCDYYVAQCRKATRVQFKHVTTCHGDYAHYATTPPNRILSYDSKLRVALGSIDHFVAISDSQVEQFAEWQRCGLALNTTLHKIWNGYEGHATTSKTRQQFGFGDSDFVFGMVSRGIHEKGWSLLVDAFVQLRRSKVKLILVGAGPAIDVLRRRHGTNPAIHFAGSTSAPIDYVNTFDVGVLPTLIPTETLPTVIMEYLFCGKPVISTDIGEIRQMLSVDSDPTIETGDRALAGCLIPFPANPAAPSSEALVAAMTRYVDRGELLQCHSNRAPSAFRKFEMTRCVEEYVRVYRSA